MTRIRTIALLVLAALALFALEDRAQAQGRRTRSAPQRSAPRRSAPVRSPQRSAPSRPSVSRPSPSRSTTSRPTRSVPSRTTTSQPRTSTTYRPTTTSRPSPTRTTTRPVPTRTTTTRPYDTRSSDTRTGSAGTRPSTPSSTVRYADRGSLGNAGRSDASNGSSSLPRYDTGRPSAQGRPSSGSGTRVDYGGSTPLPDRSGVIDLGSAIRPRHTPLPRFTDSVRPERGAGQVKPSAGYTSRTRTRPSPSRAATLPSRTRSATDLTSRYSGNTRGTTASTPGAGALSSGPPMLSERRRGTRSGPENGGFEPGSEAYRKRAAAAKLQQKQRLIRLGKKDPGRANQIDQAGKVLGNAFDKGLDLGTRVLTGGKVGSGTLLGKTRGTKQGGGKLGGGQGVGGRVDGKPTRGRDAGLVRPGIRPGDTVPGDSAGSGYAGSYYNSYYDCPDPRYWAGQCGFRASWCSPYSCWIYTPFPWVGWGWGCTWNWYWYGLGYAWRYPRYTTYSVPIYDVTTQVVYQTVVDEPEVIYEPTSGADVNAFQSEPPLEPLEESERQNLTRASEYYLKLGDRSFRDGTYGDAVHFYAKAVEFGERNGVLYMVLADALFATGDYHYAAFAIRKALELDPGLLDGTVDKRTFYSKPEDFDRQVELLERYVEDHFLDQDARLVLIVNYLFSGREKAALELLRDDFSQETAQTTIGALLGERLSAN